MLRQLSILNVESNKLLILRTPNISSKLLSTVPSKGKPTWRITYEEEDEEFENDDINIKPKGFGNITIQNTKKELTNKPQNSVIANKNKISLKKTNNELNINNTLKHIKSKNEKGKAKQLTNYSNPDFEIIKSTNSESVLFANLNPNSLFYAKYGTVVGLSSKVKIELSYEDNTDEVLKGGNGSGLFAFEKVWTDNNPGQVLLVPVKGDLMLINVKKNKEYIVKGKSLFCATSSISANDYYHNNHKFEGVKYFIVRGKGTIAIEGEGGVLEITLNEDEHFLVKPSTLLAFESCMSVKPVLSSSCTEEIEEDILEKSTNEDTSFWKKAKGMIDRAKIYVSGDQLFYRLRGPGKFYISTRIPSMSGLQSFKLNNKDKKASSKLNQKRNYSTNSRSKFIKDHYEPELENEISTLQKKLMEKTLSQQIHKKPIKKGKKRTTSRSKNQSKINQRYPKSHSSNSENDIPNKENEKSYESIIDEKAILYKKSDKVKSPKSSMFFTSRESSEEVNVERSLIKPPQKNSIDVYLDEDVGEALIQKTNNYKSRQFSLNTHQNQNLKTIINAEQKENKDRNINRILEKRTAEIKAEKQKKRLQELNPKRNFNDVQEDIVDDDEDNDYDDADTNEDDVDDETAYEEDDISGEEEDDAEADNENEDVIEEGEEEVEEIEKKSTPKKNFKRKAKKNAPIKTIKIDHEPEEEDKKSFTLKENITENKFYTFDEKNPLQLASTTSKSETYSSSNNSSIDKESLKNKKSTSPSIKKSSNLSKQSQRSSTFDRRGRSKRAFDVTAKSKQNMRAGATISSIPKRISSKPSRRSQQVYESFDDGTPEDYDEEEDIINSEEEEEEEWNEPTESDDEEGEYDEINDEDEGIDEEYEDDYEEYEEEDGTIENDEIDEDEYLEDEE